MSEEALILRTTPWREADLWVDALLKGRGRVRLLARGARRSKRRFLGLLEPGTRLLAQIREGRGLPTLEGGDLRFAFNAVRQDLDKIQHAAYVLELTRLCTPEGQPEPAIFELCCGYLEALERHPAQMASLLRWQLRLLTVLGYQLHLGDCPHSGAPADALSLSLGGAVASRQVRAPDLLYVGEAALGTLRGAASGALESDLAAEHGRILHKTFSQLWANLLGYTLRSARFLDQSGPWSGQPSAP